MHLPLFNCFRGCRPLIGLDGCHLKGSYPILILVAIGKDKNNQIFPFAWATTEVENKETSGWFLECLKNDVGDVAEGLGLTFMSDRQKFTGLTFKELFWNAARATILFDFEVAMESIRLLSEDAYEYLANLPTQHWSKHAFSDFCKSNMILNNVCGTFNAVIKDARDKPILTQMEWMRKYMMKRNSEKWEIIQKMEGKDTPYVAKVFERMEKVARYCIVQLFRGDNYDEVELNGDKVVVDLQQRTCSCYHWKLTGIPCVHAFACPKHWEKIDMRQPLPPPVKVMPAGRPKSKKRKLEKGEKGEGAGQSKDTQPKAPKIQKRCRNCG
ncbi:uncharacterized protein LOC110720549 [Chenopodium quinoa]|uniref:uncharacterized protein LOC110720549 n=1 Tax=Chenopodium quinoa TaxID=63459 RepID=UPI000B77EEB9|nr:uncharacterized protein LOC110720549 [Chenopodium quinoa]